ncbi:CD5 molecule [Genypterus blacodes]|uniref:CD5 molecule n=1 Tax=Genypterus blacodes TaxID=154954 RepID=UPI003F764B63
MDLRIVVVILSFLPRTSESDTSNTTTAVPTNPTTSTISSCDCSCSSRAPAGSPPKPITTAPVLGIFTVQWKDASCNASILTSLLHNPSSSSPVCYGSQRYIQDFMQDVCHRTKYCEGTPTWKEGAETLEGYEITENGGKEGIACKRLMVSCTGPVQASEPQGYKVATALLCILLLVIIVIRFTRPTVKALQKRLSDRRQSRWIGPTQSVSYHRGKTAMTDHDGAKRLSYPALERLVVNASREPSSNRNSESNY